MEMETVCFSKTLASINESTWHQSPEEHHHPHLQEKYFDLFCKELVD
jgi:hypothetical protein